MIRNPASALVRICAEKAGSPLGTGFIFHKDRDGVLILTSKKLIAAQASPARKIWIDGDYEADWIGDQNSDDGDLAVFQCAAGELRDREPLHLGQPLTIATTRIVYDAGLGKAGAKSPICRFFTLRGREAGTSIILENKAKDPIEPVHAGSPVIDENFAVGVVTEASEGAASSRNLIRATSIEELRRTWQGSADLITGPVPPDVAQELASPVQQLGPFAAGVLVAISTATETADLNDELAIIQETMSRRLPPDSEVELWRWESSTSLRRVFAIGPVAESGQAPSFGEFDAVILIAWNDLGPGNFGLVDLEKVTRPYKSSGQKRLIYRREGADESVSAFFEQLTEDGVAWSDYKTGSFADRFGRDFQLLVGELASATGRRQTARRIRPSEDDRKPEPYRGLESYQLRHASLFNGRSKETSDLRNILARQANGLTVVAGASGSGKSSLIRAGLFRRLQLDGIPGSSSWFVLDLRLMPGDPPLQTVAAKLLAETSVKQLGNSQAEVERLLTQQARVAELIRNARELSPAGTRFVLFVDQFEEVFTNVDEENRLAFFQFLRDAALQEGMHVVVTLRADFYPRLLDRDISPFVAGHQAYWLKPPDEQQMVSAMYWPAAASGYRFEDHDLFVQILRDAGASEGTLPLLSYALQQLSSRAKKVGRSWVMTWAAYRLIKGVQGVVERQVGEALNRLESPPKDETLNNLFRRLVKVDQTGKPTRKRADFDETDKSWTSEAVQLKKVLVDERLLTSSGALKNGKQIATIELAHEALLERWEKLGKWIAKSKESLVLIDRVEREAQEWAEERKQAATDEGRLEVDRRLMWEQDELKKVEKALTELGGRDLSDEAKAFLRPEADRLIEELKYSIGYARRCEIGERLAKIGEPRPGVGVQDGVPEIVWCYVPEGTIALAGVDPEIATRHVRPYYISQYAVTLKQFSAFTDGKVKGTEKRIYFQSEWWEGLPIKPGDHPPVQQKDIGNHPAQFVSWYQAMAFCKWLSRQLDYDIRIPDEWEWVQAATGGHSDYLYPWGREWDSTKANHRFEAYQLLAVGMYPDGTSPVGAYDMVGNMYQWCLGEFDHPDRTAPNTEPRTTRGGAFFLMPPDVDVKEQLSVRHRLRDLADGTGDRGRRVAVCIRLATEKPGPRALIAKVADRM